MTEHDRQIQAALDRLNFLALVQLDRPSALAVLKRLARQTRLFQGTALDGQRVTMGGMEVGRG